MSTRAEPRLSRQSSTPCNRRRRTAATAAFALALASPAAASEFDLYLIWMVIPLMLVIGPPIGAAIGWAASAGRSTMWRVIAVVCGAFVVTMLAPTALFVSTHIVDPIQSRWQKAEADRRMRAYSERPAVKAACAGDVEALKSALTEAAIRDTELRLHAIIDMCVFGAANPHDPRRYSAPEPAAAAPVAARPLDAEVALPPAPARLSVLPPLASALLRQAAPPAGTASGATLYCQHLQQWHREHHVFVLRALHADGLPLDCAGDTRAWWQGLTANVSDRSHRQRMFMWLGALAEMRFDFGQQGCESAPCRGTRTALDREIDARDLPLLRFLLLAGVDPTTVDGTRSNPQSAYSVWLTRSSPAREPEAVALSAADARARMLADIDEEENAQAQQVRDAAQAKTDAEVEACREKVIGSRNYVIAGGQDRCVDILGIKEYSRLRGAPPGVQMMRPKP